MAHALDRETEFTFTEADFQWLRNKASQHSGIVLADVKRNMIYSRLTKRLRKLNLRGFSEYRKLLDSGNPEEFGEFINAITTNLTSFFREPHHFEHLAKTAIPQALKRIRGSRKVRVWSAGCSTGEEPYTIAMVLAQALPGVPTQRFEVHATDLDTRVLATAQAGIYDLSRVEGLKPELLRKWFLRGAGSLEGQVRVKDELRQTIRFGQLNLIKEWSMEGPFDILFCRNVVIYFDKPTQRRLFARFAEVLEPGGNLYIGHAETLHQVSEQFRLVGKTAYQKLDAETGN